MAHDVGDVFSTCPAVLPYRTRGGRREDRDRADSLRLHVCE